jgi:hypothetical protein
MSPPCIELAWKKQLNHNEHNEHNEKQERLVSSPRPAGESHRRDKLLILFVLFVNFVVNSGFKQLCEIKLCAQSATRSVR